MRAVGWGHSCVSSPKRTRYAEDRREKPISEAWCAEIANGLMTELDLAKWRGGRMATDRVIIPGVVKNGLIGPP